MSTDSQNPAASAAADYVNSLLRDGGSPSQLMDYIGREMVPVPGFTPPSVRADQLCAIPASCSQEDINQFRSAGVLLEALAAEAKAWSEQLPPEYEPAIVALLHGGVQVEVRSLAQVSFDGIRIEGLLNDSPCSLLAHQSTVQLVCHAVRKEEAIERHPIGFIWPDRTEEVRGAR